MFVPLCSDELIMNLGWCALCVMCVCDDERVIVAEFRSGIGIQ